MWEGRATHQIGCVSNTSFMLKKEVDAAFARSLEMSHNSSTPPIGVAVICGLSIGAAKIAMSSNPIRSVNFARR